MKSTAALAACPTGYPLSQVLLAALRVSMLVPVIRPLALRCVARVACLPAGTNVAGEAAAALSGAHLAIWTTTPWTIPANLAVAVNAEMQYAVVEIQARGWGGVGLAADSKRSSLMHLPGDSQSSPHGCRKNFRVAVVVYNAWRGLANRCGELMVGEWVGVVKGWPLRGLA